MSNQFKLAATANIAYTQKVLYKSVSVADIEVKFDVVIGVDFPKHIHQAITDHAKYFFQGLTKMEGDMYFFQRIL